MTTPGGGGDRLEVAVVADASGFAADAKAKIEAAAARVKAKIQLEIEERTLAAEIKAKTAAAAKAAAAKVQVGIDEDYFRASLNRVLGALAGNHTIKVGVDVDRAQLDRALADSGRGGGTITQRIETVGGGDVHTQVHADTTEAAAEVDAFIAKENTQRKIINVGVRVDQTEEAGGGARGGRGIRNVTGGMSGLEKFGFYAGLVQTLSTAVDGLGGGLISVAGAASQAVGALAALPNLVGVLAQGGGAAMLGLSGVMGAVQALTKADTAATTAANGNGKAQADALRRVQDARKNLQKAQTDQQRTAVQGDRNVADAQRAVSDAVTAATDRLHTAEQGVASAQHASMVAQQALTQARKDAEQTLKDYKDQLADAALSEESATLAIQRARENWNKTMRSPVSSELDRREADLALRQAEQNLTDIQDKNTQLRQQAADATKAGVEGSAKVVDAKYGVEQATQSQADAEANLAKTQVDNARSVDDAQRKLADAQEKRDQSNADALDRVATAQEAITRALADQADQASSVARANSLAAAALAKLSPAGREFAHFIKDELQPKFYDLRNAVQEAFLPPVERGVKAAMPLLATLQAGMVQSGNIMGDFVERLGKMMGSDLFRGRVASIMESNNKALGSFSNAGLSLVNIMVQLAVAARPLVERFAKWVEHLTAAASAATDAGTTSGKLAAFMQRAGDRAAQLGRIVGNIARALFHFGKAGTDAGSDLLGSLDKLTQKWAAWSGDPANQAKIKKFFDDMVPVVKGIAGFIGDVVRLIVSLGKHTEALKIIVGLFDGIVKVATWLFNLPLVGPLLAGLAGLTGVAVLLLTFIKRLSKIKELFDAIGKAGTGTGKAVGRVKDKIDSTRGATTQDRTDSAAKKAGKRKRTGDDADDEVIARPSAKQRLDTIRKDTARARQESGRTVDETAGSAGTIRGRRTQARTDATDRRNEARSRAADDNARGTAINERYPVRTGRTGRGSTSADRVNRIDRGDLPAVPASRTTTSAGRQEETRVRTRGRLRSAAGHVVSRLRSEESGYMRADMGITSLPGLKRGKRGADRSLDDVTDDLIADTGAKLRGGSGSTASKKKGRVKGAAGKAVSGAKTVGSVTGGGGGGAPKTAVASDGQEVGGLGGQIGSFAATVQQATAKASTYVGGWAGDALTKVSGFAGGASKMVTDWSESGVGKAVSTAGGYIQTFASGNGETISRWAGAAKGKVGEWASDAAATAGQWAGNIGSGLASAGGAVATWAGNAASTVGTWASNAASSAGTMASNIGTGLQDAGGKIAAWASSAAGSISTVAGKITEVSTNFGRSIVDAGKAAAAWAVDKGGKILSSIASVAGAAADAAKQFGASALKAGEAAAAWIVLNGAKAAAAVVDGVLAAAEWVATAAEAAFDAALWANPIVWIVALIVGLIAIFVLLATNAFGLRDKLVAAFDWIKDKVVAAFSWMGDRLGELWRTLTGWIDFAKWRDAVVGAFEWVRDKVVAAFSWIRDTVGGIWDGIKKAIRDPLDAIINVVYNKGIVPVYNWINDLWGGKDLGEYHLPQFATGGVHDPSRDGAALPGYAPGQDRSLALLSPGEGVVVPEAVRGLARRLGTSAAGAMDWLNSRFTSRVRGPGGRGGMQAFAGGGVAGDIGSWIGDRWNDATSAVGSAIDGAKGLLSKGWQAAVHAATVPIRAEAHLIPNIGSVGQGFRDSIGQLMDKLEALAGGKEKDAQKNAGNVSGNVAQWASTVQAVLTELHQPASLTPWVLQLIAHESGGNPNAANLTDINAQRGDPSIGLMQVIGSTFRAHAGPYVGKGQRDPYASVYAGLAYGISRYGSVMNIPGIKSLATGGGYKPYDTGGRFPDGTIGYNTSGADEGVLTGKGVSALGGWARLDALNAGTPLAQLVGHTASAASATQPGGGVGTLIAEGAIQVTTINPAPEPASDTLNKTLRRVADLGIFGATGAGG